MSETKRIHRHWPSVVEQYEQSGQSVRSFCEEKGIHQSLFYKWRQRLRRGAPVDADGFVQIPGGGPVLSGVAHATSCGVRIELERGCDAATLRRMLDCLTRDGAAACSV